MNRRQLAFVILVNALVSLAIALAVVWVVESRRPDPEELAALYTPQPALAAPVATSSEVTVLPTVPAIEATAVIATPAPTPNPGEQEIYVVEAGDSLLTIAAHFHVTVDEIVAANNLANPDFVYSGQRLVIPAGSGGARATTPVPAANGSNSPTVAAAQGVQIRSVDSPGNLLDEAVLIVNESDVAFNLDGWRLERENGPAYTFGNLPLFPGGSVWVHSAEGADTSIALYWRQPSAVWQSGVAVRLINAQGEQVAQYTVP